MSDNTHEFDDLLSTLEGDSYLWNLTESSSGLAFWPFIRYRVLFHLLYVKKDFKSVSVPSNPSWRERLYTILFSIFRNPFWLCFSQHKILFFNSGVGNIRYGKKYFNRLVDHFYFQCSDKTALVEETAYGKHASPRGHAHIFSHLFFRLTARFLSLFVNTRSDNFSRDCEAIFNELKKRLRNEDVDSFLNELKLVLTEEFRQVVAQQWMYRVFFKMTKPKLILVEDACYGSRFHLLHEAKRANITVAEYQHGFINELHLAYNFGKAVNNSSIAFKYLPDYFLTYGDFWGNSVRVPSEKISIGNPYLTELKDEIPIEKTTDVFVLGSGVDPEGAITKVLNLVDFFNGQGRKVVFRPHPLEWPNAARVYSRLAEKNVVLDVGEPLYQQFTKSDIIVGELSTALYEAKAFNSKVFLIENAYSSYFLKNKKSVFITVTEAMKTNFANFAPPETEELWNADWKNAYRKFIQRFI